MENITATNTGPGLQLGDIYYLLFRHKWKIIICTALGLIGASLTYHRRPPHYRSEAKLYIKYVLDSQTLGTIDTARMKSVDERGENIITSEVHILTNMDLVKDVAKSIGPEKIAPNITEPSQLNAAIWAIRSGLFVEPQPRSNVISIVFEHSNPAIVQPVLDEIIKLYQKKHIEVHSSNGPMGDMLSKETDQLRAHLAQTEEDLRKARIKVGVISPEESKKAYATLITNLKQEIFTAQAQLAEQTAILQAISTNQPSRGEDDKNQPLIPPEAIQAHRDVIARLEALRKREQDLLIQFTPENTRVQDIRKMMVEVDNRKTQLETEFPQINLRAVIVTDSNRDQVNKTIAQIADTTALLASTEAKIKTLRQQYEQVQAEATALDQMEGSIVELRRQQELEEKNYLKFSETLTKYRSSDALGSDRVSNINQIQAPSPPIRDWSKTYKIIAGIAAGGLVLGLGWAVLIEYVFDRSIRRTNDVEQSLKLPLFLAIPRLTLGSPQNALTNKDVKLLQNPDPSDTSESMVPQEEANILNPYFETLRDRLIAYFESINLRHRPKLIAVTGLGKESGVSMTAAGLARSLSETGEGNVLLVDMTQKKGEGTAVPFFQGKAIADIDHILDSRISTKSENKLFVVSEGSTSEKLSRQLPQRFSQLVPKLKASNFDYIIFDMPPVSQISVTPRLAAAMDMVLLVVESEKTDREMAQRAAALLSKANANVGVILNKTKTYVPGKLFKDREFFLDS